MRVNLWSPPTSNSLPAAVRNCCSSRRAKMVAVLNSALLSLVAFPFSRAPHWALRRPSPRHRRHSQWNLQLHSQPHRERSHSLQRSSRGSPGARICRSRRQRRSRRRRCPRKTFHLALAGLQARVPPRTFAPAPSVLSRRSISITPQSSAARSGKSPAPI